MKRSDVKIGNKKMTTTADKKSSKRSSTKFSAVENEGLVTSSRTSSKRARNNEDADDSVEEVEVAPQVVTAPPVPLLGYIDKVETMTRIDQASAEAPRKDGEDANNATFNFYIYMEDKQNKFYEIEVKGCGAYTRYGKIGTKGNAVTAGELCSPLAAMGLLRNKVQERLRKGYQEIAKNNNSAVITRDVVSIEAVAPPVSEEIKLIKSLIPGDVEHYNDHLFHITLISASLPPPVAASSVWSVQSQNYVNRSYSTTSNRNFKTETAARKFMQTKVNEFKEKGYIEYH